MYKPSVHSTGKVPEGLKYIYVNEQGGEEAVKDRAKVLVDDDGFFGFLIRCKEDSLLKSGKRFRFYLEE